MEADSPVRKPVAVSVIVPARNEEACLGTCLRSLVEQETHLSRSDALEIIVVDDGSTDRTRAIAQSFPNVSVMSPPPLPERWSGKTNAVVAGARRATGRWLLFTDADTVHRPASLARALMEVQEHRAALLSYSPRQEVHGVLEKGVMAVIFAELAATYRPSAVSDSTSDAAAANGQYLLIERDAYFAVGGHAAVATTLLEDVALAKLVKQSGYRIRFRYAADAVQTRMYRTFSQLVEGWTKNLALLFPSAPWLACVRAAEFALLVASATVAAMPRAGRPAQFAAGATLAVTAFFFWKRIRRAHFSSDATLLAVIGLPIFSYLLLRSRLSYARGTLTWKGRTYAPVAHNALSRNFGLSPSANKLSGAADL
jgi:cellulose synthase/poly-beta-1,6-N-acetylglucosamine synthase-like glycosyltransferase